MTNITDISKTTIPTWLTMTPMFTDYEWYLDSQGNALTSNNILVIQNTQFVSDAGYDLPEIVRIHNENLFLGISDKAYNENVLQYF